MKIEMRFFLPQLFALSCTVACGSSDSALTSSTSPDGGGADASSTGGASSSDGGSSNGGTSGSGNGGASGSTSAGGTAGASSGGVGGGGSGAGGTSAGGTGAGGRATGGTGAGGRAMGGVGGAGTGGATGGACQTLGDCCKTVQAALRPSCDQLATTGTAAQCNAVLGLYCGSDGGSVVPSTDAGNACATLAACCPKLGAQKAQCDQVVSAGVALACSVFESSFCP